MRLFISCCLLLSLQAAIAQDGGTDAGGAGGSDGNVSECPIALRDGAARLGSTVGRFGHKCYTIETATKMTWAHAAETCAIYGGTLVHIENAQEEQFVAGFVQRHSGGSSVWIGLTDRFFEGTDVWVDGGGVGYNHFDPSYTNTELKDCFVIRADGYWDVTECGYRDPLDRGVVLPVMCQYDRLALAIIG